MPSLIPAFRTLIWFQKYGVMFHREFAAQVSIRRAQVSFSSISILEFFGYAVVSPMIFREIVGKSEEKRSFRTRDPDEAKHLHS